jgi:hypothetical protein
MSVSLAAPSQVGFGGEVLGQMAPVELTGDNAMDLIVTDLSTDAGSLDRVLLGRPGQSFAIGSTIGQPGNLKPTAPIAAGFFNQDAFPDFVQAMEATDDSMGDVVISINNGDGTFFRTQVLQAGIHPLAIVVGDFNNDHVQDIILSSAGDSSNPPVNWEYFGNGDGTFRTVPAFFNNQPVTTLVTADFNSDGNLDLATPQGILYGHGDGTFTTPVGYPAGNGSESIVADDFNHDGKMDLALAGGVDQPNQPAVITLLLNNGNKTFTATSLNVGTGLTGIVGMASGSLQTDSISDLVVTLGAGGGAHANQVAVVPNNGDGTFGSSLFFALGQAAGPVVVGHFNGTERNDVVALDQANGTVALLDNASFLDAQVSLTSSNINAVQGEVVQLSATCVGGQSAVPTGTVTFFDGQTSLGTANVLPSGLAPLITTQLAPGAHTITAVYNGDTTYNPATSAAITQNVTASNAVATAAVDVQVGQLTLPAVAVPGDKGKITLLLTNHGSQPASGRVSIQLFASTSGALDLNAIPLTSISNKSIKLLPGRSVKLTQSITLPTTMPVGTYQILAQMAAGQGITAAQLSSGFGPSTTIQLVDEFGTVGGRKNVKLVQALQGGAVITYSLSGAGTGTVTGGNATLTLANTNLSTKVKITQKGGNGVATLGQVTSNGSIGSFGSNKLTIGTALNITGVVSQLTLGNVNDAKISISGNGPMKASFGAVTNTNMATGGVFTTLKVASWTAGSAGTAGIIAAQSIGTLTSKGEFDADLSLHAAGLDLKSASFKGSNGGLWGIAGNIGKINDQGAWSNGGILAGTNFGPDDARGGGDDTFAGSIVTSLSITGAVNVCLFAAGLNPVDGQYLNGNDTIVPGSTFKSIRLGGTLGSESRIVAANLPPTVKVGKVTVLTASDPRFQTT